MACRSRSSNAAPVNSIRSKPGSSRQAGTKILHVHGDADTLIPTGANATELARRYRDLGGAAEIVFAPSAGPRSAANDGPELYEWRRWWSSCWVTDPTERYRTIVARGRESRSKELAADFQSQDDSGFVTGCPEGAKHDSPGQRLGTGAFVKILALSGRNNLILWMAHLSRPSGLGVFFDCSQGAALGYIVLAFQAADGIPTQIPTNTGTRRRAMKGRGRSGCA